FSLPRTIGEYEGQELSVNVGRFGPYIKLGEQFISIPRGEDLYEMDLERAIALIKEKEEADAPIAYYDNLPVTKGKGRFGPFIKWNDLF
ncbi:topoisomerase C-terminal repeat-containing protein, partial [Acinetobacter baumannii]